MPHAILNTRIGVVRKACALCSKLEQQRQPRRQRLPKYILAIVSELPGATYFEAHLENAFQEPRAKHFRYELFQGAAGKLGIGGRNTLAR